jgi:signal transduction histidine kinase
MSVDPDPLPRLLSLAVHELRTPVTVVAGYLRMLLREQGGPLSERQKKMLEEADRSCSKLGALVNEMSDLGKLSAGTATLPRQDIDIAGLLAELASDMHEGEDRGVRLELRGTDQPVVVTGDRTRLTAALRALMFSVLRERAEPGTVVAQCSTVMQDGSGFAVVAFADESLLPDLTRSDAAESLAFDEFRGGTGLALPLARRVIESHGGAVWSAANATELDAFHSQRAESPADFYRKRATSALRLPLRT